MSKKHLNEYTISEALARDIAAVLTFAMAEIAWNAGRHLPAQADCDLYKSAQRVHAFLSTRIVKGAQ